MPQRLTRLRIPPVALVFLLLGLGGSVVSACQSAGENWLSGAADVFEGADVIIRAQLSGDSTGYAHNSGERITLHPSVATFYVVRNFAPAWTDSSARDTLIALIRGTADVGLNPERYHISAFGSSGETSVPDSSASIVDQDLLLTNAVFLLADDLSGPRVDVHELYGSNWFATHRPLPPDTMLASALASPNPAVAVAQAIESLHPQDPEYKALRAMVAHQRSLVEREDWPTIIAGRAIAPGDTSAMVPTLRYRLRLERTDLPQFAGPLEMVYDTALGDAVRGFQANHGLEADGVVNQETRRALNTRPTGDIIPLLALNLERWRWLPEDLGDFHVLANIPSFELAVRERNGDNYSEHLRMNTVVGRPSWATPVFSDTMTQIVFNPTWTIPASIQIESYGRVRPGGMVRDPGPGNPLGRVKFLFPNDYAIYIHDTPSRWAFAQGMRAYSHGCIRAHDPARLAEEILTRTNAWTIADIDAKFTGPWQLQDVQLDRPVPVHIVYFTAWVDPNGQLQTYRDIYDHDAKLAEALGIELGERS